MNRSLTNSTDSRLEMLTRDYGREIFARLDAGRQLLFSPGWWDERLMEWTMGNEAVKLNLFRFIDVLPLLHSAPAIVRHLREYFDEAGPSLPAWMRLALRWLPGTGLPGRLLAWTASNNAERLARRFIAGANLQEVLKTIAGLRHHSLAFTADLLGEATITEAEALTYQGAYLELLDGLGREMNSWPAVDRIDADHMGPLPRVNVSIKLSGLYSQFDPIDPEGTSRVVRDRLRPILRAARLRHAFVNVDMEQYAFKDLTLRIFREIMEESEFRDWPDVGIAIQTYLKDTDRDLADLALWAEHRGTPIWVRLIKGAYWDFETVVAAQQGWPVPVFTDKADTDAAYERLTRFLLEHHTLLRPAFGSHNVRSLAHALALAEVLELPPRSFEIQMLFGMADPVKEALVSLGQRVRVYTPFGQLLPGMAYLVRRLLENTANESFLRATFTEHVPEEELLMNPESNQNTHTTALRLPPSSLPSDGEKSGEWSPGQAPHWQQFVNEPVVDFSKEDARQAMKDALEQVAGQLGRRYPLLIAGRTVETEATIESVNPAHVRQVVGRCASATSSHAEQAIAAAGNALPSWRDTSPQERAAYLFQSAEAMHRRRFELAAWEVLECAKQWREADADVAEAIDFCRFYAAAMLRLADSRRRDVAGEQNECFYEPRGVTVVIAPWNFPLAILCGMTSAALVTGNTVIMKPAEQSSVVGAKLMEIFQEVGLPTGVANFLPGKGEEVGPVLVRHPDVATIAFTGSKGVGLHINKEAADTPPGQDHVKRVIAEMGGKNAVIIDDDADLDEAVHGVAASAFGYQGQKCSACSRAIVLEGIYDAFLSRLVEATRSLKIGPPEDPGFTIGPVIDAEAQERIHMFIAKGKDEARLVYAADIAELAQEGFYVAPHIFADVPPESVLAREEIFGPVLAVMKARDLDHALDLALSVPYALTGGLYSRSPQSIEKVRRRFRVGNLYINRKITGALVDRQPFGGFKLSGIGSKAGGEDYLLQFVLPRTITENTMRRGFAPG